jgi:signal transduction histidine kinase
MLHAPRADGIGDAGGPVGRALVLRADPGSSPWRRRRHPVRPSLHDVDPRTEPRPPSVTERRTRDVLLRDGAIAVSMFVLFLLGATVTARLAPGFEPRSPVTVVLVGAALTMPLTFRQLAPRTVMFAITAAFSAHMLLGVAEGTISSIALFVAIYTVGAHLPAELSRWPRTLVIVVMGLFVAYSALGPAFDLDVGPTDLVGFDLVVFAAFSVLLNLAFFAAAWILGDLVRKARHDERELHRRAEELAASRERLARQAVQEERVRIARELHDVVAHHVSVMGIQAGAARRAAERDPQRAGAALANVEQASRDAIAELQRLLGFLRDDDATDATDDTHAPQPTLHDLDELVRSVRDVGLDVEVEVTGRRRPLPDTVELSAYRIVQEALTNTLRHAEGASLARVRLDYGDTRLAISVADDGTASSRTEPGSDGGRGLLGMRERAALHDGQLRVGARPGGGFLVDVGLPLREVVR